MKSGRILGRALLVLAIAGVAGWAVPQRPAARSQASALADILKIEPGDFVADVGAGSGVWSTELARAVGERGHVFSTEIDPEKLEEIRDRVTEARLANVSVIWGSPSDTGLPPDCCGAILLRRVYHHFTETAAMQASLARALRPDGLLAIIDFHPRSRRAGRDDHGISKEIVIEEMTGAGFELVRDVDGWEGRDYLVVFRLARSETSSSPP